MNKLLMTLILALSASLPAAAEKFMLIVMPDQQEQVRANNGLIFKNCINWIVQNETALNIKFVIQVGDLVDWPDAPATDFVNHTQWKIGGEGFDVLDAAGVPYAICVGNHDTMAVGGKTTTDKFDPLCQNLYNGGSAACGDTNANLRDTRPFNHFFPRSRAGLSRCTEVYETGKMDNACFEFRAGGVDWMVITLELDPRQGPLNWAKSVVAAHPNHNIIIDIHSYLDTTEGYYMSGVGYGDVPPKDVRDQFVLVYPNVRFVFSGHCGGSKRIIADGVNGNKVYQMMCAHQTTWVGWLRLIEIDTATNSFTVKTYSPYTNAYKTDYDNEFSYSGCSFVAPVGGIVDPPEDPVTPPAYNGPLNSVSYPNPYIAGSGNMNFAVSGSATGEVKIYSISGKLVKTLPVSGGGITWNGSNLLNAPVGRGLYTYVVTDPAGNKKTGKFAVK